MDSQRHLMLAPDSARHADMVTDFGLAVLAEGGVLAVTPRALGARLGCTRQAVHQWFGSQESLRHVVAVCLCRRWMRWIHVRVHSAGPAGLLPVGEEPDRPDLVQWCRAWLALVDHAPRDARIADLVDTVRCNDREEIAGLLGCDSGSDRVVLVHSLVEGLRLGLCAAEPMLTGERAVRILEAATRGVARGLA
jgi:AcrR family transcriptional regulator